MAEETQHEDNQTIPFYDLKTRAEVAIPVAEVSKTTMTRATKGGEQTRYALKAKSASGTPLTKFVSKSVYDSYDAMPVVVTPPKPPKAPKAKGK